MLEILAANWLYLILALLVGVATGWWIWGSSQKEWVWDDWSDDETKPTGKIDSGDRGDDAYQLSDAERQTESGAATTNTSVNGLLPAFAALHGVTETPSAPEPESAPQTPFAGEIQPNRKLGLVSDHGVAAKTDANDSAPFPLRSATDSTASDSAGDDLLAIKGIGPRILEILQTQGITSFSQIANWTNEDVDSVKQLLGRFSGRIEQEEWVEQAKLLAAGKWDEFIARYGD